MATSAGDVEVKLTLNADEFRRLMGESKKDVQDFSSVLNQVGTALVAAFSFAKIAGFFRDSLEAYSKQQLAVAQLVATLGAHGIASEKLVSHLEDQSRALEALTGIEQVVITRAQTMLATYGLQGAMLDKATLAAVDFTVRTGNLETSTNLLSKAFEGNTTMLKRYGIVVDQSIPQNKQFESILAQIIERFGPVAAAQAGTFAGKIAAMENAFTHLKESVGQLLAGPGGGILGWLKTVIQDTTKIVDWLNKISDATHSFSSVLGGIIIGAVQTIIMHMINILSVILDIASHIPIVGKQFAALKAQVDFMKGAVSALADVERNTYFETVKNNNFLINQEKLKAETFKNSGKVGMDVSTAMNEWIRNQSGLTKEQFLEHLKEENEGYSEFANTFITTQREMWGFATQMSNTFFTGFGDNFAKMMMEGKNFSESMKSLFKNMAEQMISYIVQIIAKLIVMFALEQATGFGGGGAVSAFSEAFATGGTITEPSIILGLQTGSRTLAGEAGPEMVSPMSGGNQGGSADGSSSRGGNITINISGQFVEGDQNSWSRLVREQIIPQIRRYTMSNPTGPFNRTRGVS